MPEWLQAQDLVEGYARARAEWPWMGVMFVWKFRDPEPLPGEPATYFQIVNQDWTPRPAYTALQAYARRFPIADTGAHLITHPAVQLTGDWVGDGGSLSASRVVTATASGHATIRFQGTRLDLIVPVHPYESGLELTLDGKRLSDVRVTAEGAIPLLSPERDPDWSTELGQPVWRLVVAQGLADGSLHTLVLGPTVAPLGTGPLVLAGFVVSREQPAAWGPAFAFAYGTLTLLLGWIAGRLLGNLFALPGAVVGAVRGRRGVRP